MQRRVFGQIGKLKADKIEEYKKLHANPWPGVLKTIKACHLDRYYIFLQGPYVFATFLYDGDDYDADMKKMEEDPVTQEWWTHTKPCFETYAVSDSSEFYHDMEQIFSFEKQIDNQEE